MQKSSNPYVEWMSYGEFGLSEGKTFEGDGGNSLRQFAVRAAGAEGLLY